MGYIVGRNSAPLTASDQRPRKEAPPTEPASSAPTEAAAREPEQPKPEEPVRASSGRQTEEAAKPSAAPAAPEASGLHEPQSGETYLQVLATARTEADLVAESLRKKGYAAHVTTSPSPTLFRVIVGPFSDTAELSRSREGLVTAGFQKPIVRKY
jgi:cell division septation protein DedD